MHNQFMKRCPSEQGALGFGEVVEAILVVYCCSLGDSTSAPLPSVVRRARQTVHMASQSLLGVWKSALALMNHECGESLME